MRSTSNLPGRLTLLALVAAGAPVAGCALSEGNPWGTLEAGLEASFAPPASRLTADGRLKTDQSYTLQIDTLEVGLGSLTVAMKAEGGAVSFDPANPPAGYSLCHNGHCHAADGGLVSYEEIEAELNGGAAPTGASVIVPIQAGVVLSDSLEPVTLGECPALCDLPRGELGTVALSLTSIRFSGRVFDGSNAGRLPEEGATLSGEIPLEVEATAELEGAVDRGEPMLVGLEVDFPLTERLFDGIDWQTALEAGIDPAAIVVADGEDAAERIKSNLDEYSALSVTLERGAP